MGVDSKVDIVVPPSDYDSSWFDPMQLSALRQGSLDVKTAWAAYHTGIASVLETLALNWRLPASLMVALARVSSDSVVLVGDDMGAQEAAARIRRYVASNQQAPDAALQILARDSEIRVCVAVAANPGASARVLADLIAHPRIEVAEVAARNPGCSPWVLQVGLERFGSRVKEVIAQRTNCPPSILRQLMEIDNCRIREILAHRGDLSWEMFQMLARDKRDSVRAVIAGNAQCPWSVVSCLLEDSNDDIRWEALRHPLAPDHIRIVGILGRFCMATVGACL